MIDLYGTPTLLMHGDTLCTDDTDYQSSARRCATRLGSGCSSPKPLAERAQIARDLRGKSEQAKQGKAMAIMDVAPAAVDDSLRAPMAYPRLIHGHTHRPARHEHRVDGHGCERWVLADWYEHGCYLSCDASGCKPQPLA